MIPKHQTPEGARINGSGIRVETSNLTRQTTIIVTAEELAGNPLVKNWVDAIIRASDTACTETALRKSGLFAGTEQ